MIISVLNQKGGVGKTTLATHLAAGFALSGKRVLLVDADPQHSALDWGAKREDALPFTLLGQPTAVLHRDLPPLVGNPYEVIVIDGPGKLTDVPRSAIMASDVVLIPVQPSPYDVWASDDIVKILNDARVFKPHVKAAFVITRKFANTVLGRELEETFKDHPVGALKTQIHQRQCFATTAGSGLSVIEAKPVDDSHRQAVQEIRALVEEVEQFANGV